jgi:hypothetical protein
MTGDAVGGILPIPRHLIVRQKISRRASPLCAGSTLFARNRGIGDPE